VVTIIGQMANRWTNRADRAFASAAALDGRNGGKSSRSIAVARSQRGSTAPIWEVRERRFWHLPGALIAISQCPSPVGSALAGPTIRVD
jgi:hypothetical protein